MVYLFKKCHLWLSTEHMKVTRLIPNDYKLILEILHWRHEFLQKIHGRNKKDISKRCLHRPSISVTVTSFELAYFLRDEESVSLRLLSVKNPGCFGSGSAAVSLSNIISTHDIIGRSSGRCWTHKRPTWIHLNASDTGKWPPKDASNSSTAFPSPHSFHAYNV